MNYKSSSVGGALSYSPDHPNCVSMIDVNTLPLIPLGHHYYCTGEALALAITASQQSPGSLDVIYGSQGVRNVSKLAQWQLLTLNQAIGRHPGMPTTVASLVDHRLQAPRDHVIEMGPWCTRLKESLRQPHMTLFGSQSPHQSLHEPSQTVLSSQRAVGIPELNLQSGVQNMSVKHETVQSVLQNSARFKIISTKRVDHRKPPPSTLPRFGTSKIYHGDRRGPSVSQTDVSTSTIFKNERIDIGDSTHSPPVPHRVYAMLGLQSDQARVPDDIHLNQPDHLVRK